MSLAGLGTSLNQNDFFMSFRVVGWVVVGFFFGVHKDLQCLDISSRFLSLSEGGLGPMSTEQVKCSCGNVSSKAAPSIKLNKRGSAATSGRIRARG